MSDYPFAKVPGTPEQLQARRKWVDALRSGEYTQAKGALKTPEGMCCLGVLCDVSGKGTWKQEGARNFEFHELDGGIGYVNLDGLDVVKEWAGVPGVNVQIPHFGEAPVGPLQRPSCFTELNDNLSFTFDQIADVIEERFEVAPKA